jgi:catechol 2,3-dioxygenase-like lactoylglutathione lyase family enzyme
MVELAKPAIDVGLYTNSREAQLAFWQQQPGVKFSELLRVGGGVHQLRHAIGDSVLKINDVRETLAAAPDSGIRKLTIASDVAEVIELIDPDGNQLSLAPRGHDGIEQIRITLVVSNLATHQAFWGEIMGFPALNENCFQCGVSQLELIEGEATADPVQRALGYRYLTVQVFDVKATHAAILAGGGREGSAPIKLGDVAHISFVRDPDGNWLEISQRKSITGSLD